MRTKILVLYKSDSSSEEMLNTIFEPLSAHWEFEVKKLDLHHASTFGLKEKLWETFSSADSGLLTNLIENKIKSKLVQSLLPKLLTELREFQPPIVLSLDSQGTYLISHLKESGLYLGKVAVLSCGFYFTQEDIKDEVDLYICTSELHRNSLKQLGVKQDKQIMIKNILPSEFFSPTNSEDLNHKFGLLTTMPVILFYVSGSKTADAIEAYKRLLRSNDSFQILVFNPDNTMIPEFEKISAPPRHPVKFYSDDKNFNNLLDRTLLLIANFESAVLMLKAASKNVPVTVLGTPDASPELEFLVKNQLVSAARIPAEVAFFVESLIAGKKLTNPQQVLSALSVTTVEKDLMEALGTLKPPGTVKVQNYQEN